MSHSRLYVSDKFWRRSRRPTSTIASTHTHTHIRSHITTLMTKTHMTSPTLMTQPIRMSLLARAAMHRQKADVMRTQMEDRMDRKFDEAPLEVRIARMKWCVKMALLRGRTVSSLPPEPLIRIVGFRVAETDQNE